MTVKTMVKIAVSLPETYIHSPNSSFYSRLKFIKAVKFFGRLESFWHLRGISVQFFFFTVVIADRVEVNKSFLLSLQFQEDVLAKAWLVVFVKRHFNLCYLMPKYRYFLWKFYFILFS